MTGLYNYFFIAPDCALPFRFLYTFIYLYSAGGKCIFSHQSDVSICQIFLLVTVRTACSLYIQRLQPAVEECNDMHLVKCCYVQFWGPFTLTRGCKNIQILYISKSANTPLLKYFTSSESPAFKP